MKNIKYLNIICALLVIFITASCGYEPEIERAGERPTYNTVEVLDLRGYSILNEAIAHAELGETLLNSDSLTLFAPSNTAFEALLSSMGVTSVTDLPSATVANILSYHVVPTPVYSSGLPSKATTLSGDVIYIAADASLNGKAVISEPDMVSNNTVIHGINKVLDVPSGNLLQQIQANDSLSILATAIEAAGLNSLFTGSDEYTIFAPVNSAFEGIDVNALTPAQLADILGFHVVAGVKFSQFLPGTGRIATIQGNMADDNVQEITKDGAALNGSAIIATNQTANNGVIHQVSSIISKVTTRKEYLDPAINASGIDSFFLDQFNDVIEGANYSGISQLADTLTIFPVFQGPTYADFASDADAIDYLESHTFAGSINLFAQDNGTKVTAINGNSYYMVDDGFEIVSHNGAFNAYQLFGTGSTFVLGSYNITIGMPSQELSPLPSNNLLEVLSGSADYNLFAALVEKVGRDNLLTSGEATVFAVSNSVITNALGATSEAEIEAIEDEALLEVLTDIVNDHIIPSSVNFSAYVAAYVPALTSASENTIQFAQVEEGGETKLVIVTDPAFPSSDNIELVAVDIPANNGVIHEVEGLIQL